MRFLITLVFAALLFTACTSEEEGRADDGARDLATQEQLAERGQQIFRDRTLGEYEIACLDCHADFDEALTNDDRIRPGHGILGAHQRVDTWNGEFSGDGLRRTAAGASKCAYMYQGRGSGIDDALTESEAAALMAFYEYISPGDHPPRLDWDVVTWPGDADLSDENFEKEMEGIDKLRGNPSRGEEMFDRTCAPCHDTGIGPAVRHVRRKVDRLPAIVRGGSDSMPFFSRDKLTDQNIADIQAFVRSGM
ncbi:MAG: hypothetical protein C0600_01910 [Ignavibacteria bacterium]|nr:MAG: hypothetical protein C0600_01910 [Ignavibacteria bacterium]